MKYTQLIQAIDSTSQQLLGRAATAVNQALVIRNWLVGAYIVEFGNRSQVNRGWARICARFELTRQQTGRPAAVGI